MTGKIIIRGAREHNLKNINLEIPRDQLVVITGVSGSGKSSLAFDTLYAEGQRRYVESLSAYARQFLEQMERPDVDSIEGLSPAISIEQRSAGQNPRSTVGTITEIYDYLRLLFARLGKPYCYQCGKEISAQTIQQIVDRLLALPPQTQIHILAPIVSGRKGEYRQELKALAQAGFARVKIDRQTYDLGEEISLAKTLPHDIDLVVDRLVLKEGIAKRLADSLEVASHYGHEVIKVEILSGPTSQGGEEITFSQKFACVQCGVSYPEIAPRLFSFNSPYGACPACGGLGVRIDADVGTEDFQFSANHSPCPECKGTRLKKEALHIKLGGQNIAHLTSLSVKEAIRFLTGLELSDYERTIGQRVLKEIVDRLNFMVQVGLEYLTLARSSATLSGGEAQRIRLATQIGSSLTGVLYILDEPSIGLHPRDNARLLDILKRLRDLGNSILVVEHDREAMLQADHVIDMGPGSGLHGGEVVAQGTPQEIMKNERSLTGQYLSGRLEIPVPSGRRSGDGRVLVLKGVRQNNLKNVTVEIPLGTMTCVTGVSGSGKSSLVVDTLYTALAQRLYRSGERSGLFQGIQGWEHFDKVVSIDQSPIGRTPRSNPATYTGLFDHVRALFSQLPEARMRGYRPGRFSFNVKGGRCEACAGDGVIKIEMHFLPDLFVTCEVCRGRRYNRETLELLYKGRNIADVLDLTVNQALEFLGNVPPARQKLETLRDVGLGYIRIGQSAPTLSGGEAQRIKLSRELSRRSTGRALYILDEPTTGLHFDDIKKLLGVLNRLVDAGNTVVIIEHNLDVIKSADYIIDLGPEGGDLGGEVVATGSPEEISLVARSYTGRFLGQMLKSLAA
ncbi:MAG TPA: excinuclease ABC subunit UvrA [Candidatus Binatia bacterium]|jgi:excinuclease ABC subunit A|nr:excinuclease ABC subunit UvrA [Candidatus Binatia bacterium]